MKAIVLYRPESEFSRAVEEFVHDFRAKSSQTLQLVDIDTTEGAALAELHDVLENPAVLVLRDDGQPVKSWTGVPLPLINDVIGHLTG